MQPLPDAYAGRGRIESGGLFEQLALPLHLQVGLLVRDAGAIVVVGFAGEGHGREAVMGGSVMAVNYEYSPAGSPGACSPERRAIIAGTEGANSEWKRSARNPAATITGASVAHAMRAEALAAGPHREGDRLAAELYCDAAPGIAPLRRPTVSAVHGVRIELPQRPARIAVLVRCRDDLGAHRHDRAAWRGGALRLHAADSWISNALHGSHSQRGAGAACGDTRPRLPLPDLGGRRAGRRAAGPVGAGRVGGADTGRRRRGRPGGRPSRPEPGQGLFSPAPSASRKTARPRRPSAGG